MELQSFFKVLCQEGMPHSQYEAVRILEEMKRHHVWTNSCTGEYGGEYSQEVQLHLIQQRSILCRILHHFPDLLIPALDCILGLAPYGWEEEAVIHQVLSLRKEPIQIQEQSTLQYLFDPLFLGDDQMVRILHDTCGVTLSVDDFPGSKDGYFPFDADTEAWFRMLESLLKYVTLIYDQSRLDTCSVFGRIMVYLPNATLFQMALSKGYLQQEPRNCLLELLYTEHPEELTPFIPMLESKIKAEY